MRYREAVAAAALLFAVPGLAFGQAAKVLPGGCGSVDLTGLDTYPLTMSTTGKQCTEGTGGGGASGNVNVTQFGSNNVVTGTGASGSGIPRVTVSNDSTVGITPVTTTGTACGQTLTTAGTAYQVVANATTRKKVLLQNANTNGANVYFSLTSTTPVAGAADTYVLFPGGSYSTPDGITTTTAIYATASANSSTITCTYFN